MHEEGEANVIASTEPLDGSITGEVYAEVQGDLLESEFPGYRQYGGLEQLQLEGLSDRGFLREFSWTPPDGVPVRQVQVYAVRRGRGFTATATTPESMYDKGRFRCYWDLIQTAIKVNPEGLSPLLRAALETSKCLLDVASADSALCELKALRSEPRLSRRERDQLELSRVETLVWLAGRSEKFRLRAEVAAREALARARARGEVARERSSADEMRKDEAGLAEARAAYLALLADDDHVARVIFEGTPERPDSWRVMALRATTAVRTLRPEDASVLTQEVLERRRHDLDRRCSLVHAALLAEQTAFAIREAAGVVQLAPDHVLGRLLYAESLYLGAGAPDSKGNEDYQQLILACKQYAKTLRLRNGLDAFLSRWQAAGPVGSELLSDEILEHAARQCAHAAVRASHALARAGLPPDRAMLKNGDYALSRLYWVDRQEAIRLQSLLGCPRRDKRRRWLKCAACLSFGTAIGVGVVVDWWGSQRLDEIGVRPAVAGLALLIAIFPLVRKISIFGVDLEPPEAVDLLGASGNILLGGIASIRRGLTRLISPTNPPTDLPAGAGAPPPNGGGGGAAGQAVSGAEAGHQPAPDMGTAGPGQRRDGARALNATTG